MKKMLRVILCIVALLIIIALIYVTYVFVSYERIEDNIKVPVTGEYQEKTAEWTDSHTILTYNIGYGAYSQDYTFFMDGGTDSRGRSEEEVKGNVEGALEIAKEYNPDFLFFQEVDIMADRSFDIDQSEMISQAFPNYQMAEAINYDSAYLFYPILDPIGKSKSELVTLSKYQMEEGVRRSLPISEGFNKFFDLDRCYVVNSVTLTNGKSLYLYNVHLSAYGIDASIRDAQMKTLFDDMNAKLEEGHYVIAGGDFNHDFTGNSGEYFNEGKEVDYSWAQPFPDEYLGENFVKATDYEDGGYNPTSRLNDVPYTPEDATVVTIDGFIHSKNIKIIKVENINTEFEYTDHMPVLLEFKVY